MIHSIFISHRTLYIPESLVPLPCEAHERRFCEATRRGRTRSTGWALAVLVCLGLFRSASASLRPAGETSPGPNLLENADFKNGAQRWTLQADTPASVTVELLGAEIGPPGVPGKVAHFDVKALGAHNWNLQFSQAGLDLADGEAYTLTFWARADRERIIGVNMALDMPDWHPVGLSAYHTPLTRNWHKFAYVFMAARTAKRHNRLGVVLGDALGTVDLAGISLCHKAIDDAAGPNLLQNANFSNGAQDWTLQHSDPASAKVEWSGAEASPPGVPGKVARLDVTALSANNWNIQFFQPGLDLIDGEAYTLTFWARADHERPLSVNVALDVPDWHMVGLDYQTALTPTWRKVVMAFTAVQTVRDHNRLSFLLGDALGQVELAGISLKRDIQADPSHATHPLVGVWEGRTDDPSRTLRLTLNADGTGSLRSVTTAAASGSAPHEPVAHPLRWYVKEAGHRVIIGSEGYTWSIDGAGVDAKLTLTDQTGKSHVFYRR